ncbi:hypothetical protein DRJ19_04360, partial [Candidatus Woesearchaeota archaeon]
MVVVIKRASDIGWGKVIYIIIINMDNGMRIGVLRVAVIVMFAVIVGNFCSGEIAKYIIDVGFDGHYTTYSVEKIGPNIVHLRA